MSVIIDFLDHKWSKQLLQCNIVGNVTNIKEMVVSYG